MYLVFVSERLAFWKQQEQYSRVMSPWPRHNTIVRMCKAPILLFSYLNRASSRPNCLHREVRPCNNSVHMQVLRLFLLKGSEPCPYCRARESSCSHSQARSVAINVCNNFILLLGSLALLLSAVVFPIIGIRVHNSKAYSF